MPRTMVVTSRTVAAGLPTAWCVPPPLLPPLSFACPPTAPIRPPPNPNTNTPTHPSDSRRRGSPPRALLIRLPITRSNQPLPLLTHTHQHPQPHPHPHINTTHLDALPHPTSMLSKGFFHAVQRLRRTYARDRRGCVVAQVHFIVRGDTRPGKRADILLQVLAPFLPRVPNSNTRTCAQHSCCILLHSAAFSATQGCCATCFCTPAFAAAAADFTFMLSRCSACMVRSLRRTRTRRITTTAGPASTAGSAAAGSSSRRRGCHCADAPSQSVSKRLLEREGVQLNDGLLPAARQQGHKVTHYDRSP